MWYSRNHIWFNMCVSIGKSNDWWLEIEFHLKVPLIHVNEWYLHDCRFGRRYFRWGKFNFPGPSGRRVEKLAHQLNTSGFCLFTNGLYLLWCNNIRPRPFFNDLISGCAPPRCCRARCWCRCTARERCRQAARPRGPGCACVSATDGRTGRR